MPAQDWIELSDGFRAAVKPLSRSANWKYFCFPFALFGFGITLSTMPEPVVKLLGIPFVLFIFLGPLGIYLWHSAKVKRLAQALEANLRSYPRVSAPAVKRGATPRWLQIAVLIMVGPELIFQIFGTLFPRAYERSPWQGLHLDLVGLAGVLLFATWHGLQWRRRRLERAAEAKAERAMEAVQARPGRRGDVIARARGSEARPAA